MSDPTPNSRPSLSEISHLFLTELRQRQTNGAARPARKPPGEAMPRAEALPPVAGGDEKPAEIAVGSGAGEETETISPARRSISLVIAHHLGAAAARGALDYARHVAATSGPVALIELAEEGLRISSLEASAPEGDLPGAVAAEAVNFKVISHALEELSWDIGNWLIFLPAPRSQGAQEIISRIGRWTLLVGAADETVVGGYRALKGLLSESVRPTVSLAVAGAEDQTQADLIHRKLDRAARQFLNVELLNEGRVASAPDARAHVALCCRCTAGVTQEHWNAVAAWAVKAFGAEAVDENQTAHGANDGCKDASLDAMVEEASDEAADAFDLAVEEQPVESSETGPIESTGARESFAEPIPMKITPTEQGHDSASFDQVLDLSSAADSAGILDAILKAHPDWIAAPGGPPRRTSSPRSSLTGPAARVCWPSRTALVNCPPSAAPMRG